MSARKIRRQLEHKARKLARKAGIPYVPPSNPAPATDPAAEPSPSAKIPTGASLNIDIPEPGFPSPSLYGISPARLEANRRNSQLSHGPLTPETKAISAQNRTIHGLARHRNGTFKLMDNEDPAVFEALKKSLQVEHAPATETESILVTSMAESRWLADRALRLLDTSVDTATGAVTNEKLFSLYMRYQTTHTRAFHKSLNDLNKLRSEKRRAELGVEAQRVKTERHELKKETHYWDIIKKDSEAYAQIMANIKLNNQAHRENPDFQEQFEAELAKRGLANHPNHVAVAA